MADPTGSGPLPFQEIIQYGGMAVGAAVAALLVRLGWKKPLVRDTDIAISGQAAITDLKPLKDILAQLDTLTLWMQKAVVSVDSQNAIHTRSAEALERLAEAMLKYLDVQSERQERADLEATIREQLRREMEQHGEEPATQPTRKR